MTLAAELIKGFCIESGGPHRVHHSLTNSVGAITVMPDFTFELPGCLTFSVGAGDEQAAKAVLHQAFAHLNTNGIDLTTNVRIVAIETARAQAPEA
jgi:hypothetical protein